MNDLPDAALAYAVVALFADGPTTHHATSPTSASRRPIGWPPSRPSCARLGARAAAGPDWLRIEPGPLHGAEIETYDDHRMAMAFALAGLRVPGVVIQDPGCVAKTWPDYFEVLRASLDASGTSDASDTSEARSCLSRRGRSPRPPGRGSTRGGCARRFGDHRALDQVTLDVSSRRDLRPAGRQRRRQDHVHPPGDRLPAAQRRQRAGGRALSRHRPAARSTGAWASRPRRRGSIPSCA